MAELETNLLRPDESHSEESDEVIYHPAGYTTKREQPEDIYAHIGDWQSQTGGVITD